MRQNKNKSGGLSAFLEASGVLASGSSEEIERQKRIYWNRVKREQKKQKRKEHKIFEILLTKKEFELVKEAAKQQHCSVTKYIKSRAIQTNDAIVSPVVIGEVREALYLNYNAIERYIEEGICSQMAGDILLKRMENFEKSIFKLFGKGREDDY